MNRNHNRVPVEIEISMLSEHNFYTGITDNVSEGGVFIATHQPPAVGAEVEMVLSLPETPASFLVKGVVRWLRSFEASCEGMPPGCGIQWQALDIKALAAIQDFVRRRETLYYEGAA